MREKYESLSVAVLRDLAKSRGIAKVSTMKKAELIEAMVAEDEKAQPASEDAKNIDEKKKETTEEKNETIDIHVSRMDSIMRTAKMTDVITICRTKWICP